MSHSSLEYGPVLSISSEKRSFLLPRPNVPYYDILRRVGIVHHCTVRHQIPIGEGGRGQTRGTGQGEEGKGVGWKGGEDGAEEKGWSRTGGGG